MEYVNQQDFGKDPQTSRAISINAFKVLLLEWSVGVHQADTEHFILPSTFSSVEALVTGYQVEQARTKINLWSGFARCRWSHS